MNSNVLSVGSLFSGVGGLDLGLEWAGMEVKWQVENDDYCSQVLAKHWPNTPRFGDIRALTGDELAPVDLICGGFPCQPVSNAGNKRKAQTDERWLWPEFARIICKVRPQYVIVENVPGLLQRGLSDVLGSLAECGYDAEWDIIPAAAVGAPHLRERLFIVAYANGIRNQAKRGKCSYTKKACRGRYDNPGDGSHHAQWERSVYPARESTCEASTDIPWQVQRWFPTPRVCRRDDGIPHRLDRLKVLGNSVVPQVAERIGNLVVDFDKGRLNSVSA